MATIEKRGPYQYRVKVRRKGYKTTTNTFNSRKEAEKWGRAVEAEMDRGSYVSSSTAQRTTLRAVLDRYKAEVFPRLSDSGKKEEARLNHLKGALGDLSLNALDASDIAQYRDKRLYENKLSPQTVKHELGLLNRVLKQCVIDWGIHLPRGIVTANVRIPSPPAGRDRRLSVGEEEKLLSAAQKSKSKEIVNIIIIAIETAARRGEIFAMEWKHINFNKRTWHIPKTKTDVPRTVPLSSRAIQVLQGIPRRIDGKVWSLSNEGLISQAFGRLCRTKKKDGAVIEHFFDLRFHDLRHEGTSRLFEKGLNIMEVASITGHKDLRSLRRYTHLRAEDLVDKLDQVAGSRG